MEYKLLNGKKIPVLGIGTWRIGGGFEATELTPAGKQRLVEALREAVRLGMTHIDTAEVYAAGSTEEIVAEAIKAFPREELFITSKVWRDNLRYDDVLKAAHNSLKRLGIKYLDLYLIHWPSAEMPISETMKAFEKLLDDGLIRNIGVSNFSAEQVREAQSHLKRAKITAVQNEFNILHHDDELLKHCEKEKITLIAYQPLAKGKLAKPGIPELDKLAAKYGKSQAQVALNWLLAKKPVITIPKSTTKEHMLDNLGALGWKMPEADYKLLDNVTSK